MRCGLIVVDIRSGETVQWLRCEPTVEELYDVAVLPEVAQAEAVGLRGGEMQSQVTIER